MSTLLLQKPKRNDKIYVQKKEMELQEKVQKKVYYCYHFIVLQLHSVSLCTYVYVHCSYNTHMYVCDTSQHELQQ